MNKKKYPLNALLIQKQRKKDEAIKELALCIKQLQDKRSQKKEILENITKVKRQKKQRIKEIQRPEKISILQSQAQFLTYLDQYEIKEKERLTALEQEIGQSIKEVERAQEKLKEKIKDLKLIEKHKTRWEEARLQELSKNIEAQDEETRDIIWTHNPTRIWKIR